MTKNKNGRKGHTDRATSGDVVPTESSSTVAFTDVQGHEAECRDQTEYQTCQDPHLDEFEMAIRELAYSKWEAAGFPAGDGFDFWLEAEREVKAVQQASPPAQE